MSILVVSGASLMCPFGTAPGTLMVLPTTGIMCANMPAATIKDFMPMVNIPTFGMCSSLANPTVASATASASGVLTPMPCVPNTVAPWAPGSPTVTVGGVPALTNASTCMCAWGGTISITMPGQTVAQVP